MLPTSTHGVFGLDRAKDATWVPHQLPLACLLLKRHGVMPTRGYRGWGRGDLRCGLGPEGLYMFAMLCLGAAKDAVDCAQQSVVPLL